MQAPLRYALFAIIAALLLDKYTDYLVISGSLENINFDLPLNLGAVFVAVTIPLLVAKVLDAGWPDAAVGDDQKIISIIPISVLIIIEYTLFLQVLSFVQKEELLNAIKYMSYIYFLGTIYQWITVINMKEVNTYKSEKNILLWKITNDKQKREFFIFAEFVIGILYLALYCNGPQAFWILLWHAIFVMIYFLFWGVHFNAKK